MSQLVFETMRKKGFWYFTLIRKKREKSLATLFYHKLSCALCGQSVGECVILCIQHYRGTSSNKYHLEKKVELILVCDGIKPASWRIWKQPSTSSQEWYFIINSNRTDIRIFALVLTCMILKDLSLLNSVSWAMIKTLNINALKL